LNQDKYQGKIYALPIALQDYMLIYSKKAFQDAGITSPPVTTSEWAADIAKTTKVDANGNITQLGYFFPSIGITTGQNQAELAYSFGGSWYGPSGKPTPDNAGTVAACSFYVDNVPAKYGADKVNQFVSGFGDTDTAQDPLYNGKLAMRVDGEWMSSANQQFAPGWQWGVVPIPYPDGHPEWKDSTQVDVSMIFIPNNSAHKQQAWEFLKFLVSKTPMRQFTLNGNNPARYSLLSDSAYNNMPNFSVWENELRSPNAKTLPTEPFSAQYTADIGTALSNANLLHGTCKSNLQQLAARANTYSG
jgi:multiple sugar transport system substrate-binding protein